jgi:hypothetical protein
MALKFTSEDLEDIARANAHLSRLLSKLREDPETEVLGCQGTCQGSCEGGCEGCGTCQGQTSSQS